MSFVKDFLYTLDCIESYHWQTRSYSRHKVTEELYKKLNSSVDTFVETYYGKYKSRPEFKENAVIELNNWTDSDAETALGDFAQYLRTDLETIIENDPDLLHL
jgi:hypothetical protein